MHQKKWPAGRPLDTFFCSFLVFPRFPPPLPYRFRLVVWFSSRAVMERLERTRRMTRWGSYSTAPTPVKTPNPAPCLPAARPSPTALHSPPTHTCGVRRLPIAVRFALLATAATMTHSVVVVVVVRQWQFWYRFLWSSLPLEKATTTTRPHE